MFPVSDEWIPVNEYTRPLQGRVHNRNEGIIKAVDFSDGSKYSVGEIAYEEYGEDQFQYIFTPYWHVIDGLPADVFQGIPGLKMELRLPHYYRVNMEPVFITQRTPSRNREDLWELLASVGLDYYDRLEWLVRTDMRSGNDNLIVERKETDDALRRFLSYAKKGSEIMLSTKADMGTTPKEFSKNLYEILSAGRTVSTVDESFSVSVDEVPAMLKLLISQKRLDKSNRKSRQKEGIDRARDQGKYKGRKRIEVNEFVLQETMRRFNDGEIGLQEAMKLTGLSSKSTFYRRRRELSKE